jgi:hypothetical protein
MNTLNQYIIEKLHLNKDVKTNDFFISHITDNPHDFSKQYNYLLSSDEWKKNRYAILLEYVSEILKENLLTDKDDIEFVKKFDDDLAKIYATCYTDGFGYLKARGYDLVEFMNGPKPYFGTAKFVYDVLNYALSKDNLTIPRRQKIEKWLRESFYKVEKYKNEMNWY